MNRSYMTVTEVTDYGPYISKIILPLSETVKSEVLSEDTFNVYVERRSKKNGEVLQLRKDWTSKEFRPSKDIVVLQKRIHQTVKGTKPKSALTPRWNSNVSRSTV